MVAPTAEAVSAFSQRVRPVTSPPVTIASVTELIPPPTGPISLFSTTCFGITLAPGESCAVSVIFAPTTTGTAVDQLYFNSSVGPLVTIGVVGLSIALPLAQLTFLRSVRTRLAFALGCISLACLVFTMALAWGNELSKPLFLVVADMRGMVSVHGVINTLVVAPCFLLAVSLTSASRPS